MDPNSCKTANDYDFKPVSRGWAVIQIVLNTRDSGFAFLGIGISFLLVTMYLSLTHRAAAWCSALKHLHDDATIGGIELQS